MKMPKKSLQLLTIMLVLSLALPVLAQEATTTASTETTASVASTSLPTDLDNLVTGNTTAVSAEAIVDENVSDANLGVEPVTEASTIGNWFNSLKQKISLALTFDKVKNAEKHLQYANEKMARARFMLDNAKDRKAYDRALSQIDKANELIDQTKAAIEEFRNRPAKTESETNDITRLEDTYANQLILHHRLLQKLESQVPEQAFDKIKAASDRRLEHLKDVFEKIDNNNQEKITERLRRAFEEQKGSELKPLADLEFIEQLKEKYPDKQKEIFDRIMNLRHKELAEKLKEVAADKRAEKVEQYLNFSELTDPEKKAALLERRQELLEKISANETLGDSLKATFSQAKNIMEKNREVVEKLKEKTDVLKEKAEKGDVKAKEVLQKLEAKTNWLDQQIEERIQEAKKPLPAFDEKKWDNEAKKPIIQDDDKNGEQTDNDPATKLEIKDLPNVKIIPVQQNSGIIIKPAIKAIINGQPVNVQEAN